MALARTGEITEFIPLEKSWIIRMGILDLVHGRQQIGVFLDAQDNLGDDLLALSRVSKSWQSNRVLDVGESGTLYRFLLFTTWSLNLDKKFKVSGTLRYRHVTEDPNIARLSQEELLQLDSGTSQWASAKALLGDKRRLKNPPHLLSVTYEAIEHWNDSISKGVDWEPKKDRTILAQAEAFLEILDSNKTEFKPTQAEDYCFSRALDLITKKSGESRWPALRSHESDRILSMEEELSRAMQGKLVQSKDHRVVQALAFWGALNKKKVYFKYPQSVNKTWPLFWEFMEWATDS